jgi:hypothetical protein
MKITTFRNMKGLIHGPDPKRIGCDRAGTLKIGTTVINISPGEDAIMPLLFNGCTGDYEATFTTSSGVVYQLDKVAVRDGRIKPPSPATVELMELRLRQDKSEEEIEELKNIFDTNSLNFLIK